MSAGSNALPKWSLAIVLAFFAYGALFVENGAGGGVVETLGVPGAMLLYAAILATFATIFVAARRAVRAGSWPWFVAVILVWPAGFFYALVMNPDD